MSDVRFSELVRPTARQRAFWRAVDRHRFVLYGGARGGGKSYILRWTLVRLLLDWYRRGLRHVRVGLFCEDYPALRDRQISKVEVEFPRWLGTLNRSANEFRLGDEFGAGVICFRNLDDPSKYQSAEFAAIAVDELTKNPVHVFNVLRGSLRWPGIDHLPFVAATNPGGPGHLWVKQYWLDRQYPPELEPLAREFAFVRSLPADNPHLSAAYWTTLRSLPEALRKAWVEGAWDCFEGQYFDEWNPDVHTVEPFDVPEFWEVEAGMDWGYSPHPGVIVWAAFDPFGRAWAYQELVFERSSPRQVAEMIAGRCRSETERRMLIRGDTQMWTPQPDRGVSIAGEINARLSDLRLEVTLVQANKDRLNGWAMVHQYLDPRRPTPHGEGACPWLRCLRPDAKRGCGTPHLIRTLPAQVHDPDRPGDLLKRNADDAADALRYLLIARPPLTEPPVTAGATPHDERVHGRTRRILEKVRRRQQAEADGIPEGGAEEVDHDLGPTDADGLDEDSRATIGGLWT